VDDDWLEKLGDFGPDTPPDLIDEGIARSADAADEAMLFVRASLFLVRHVQAAMFPGRLSAPDDLDQAVRAGRRALAELRTGADVYPELESAILQVVAEALQLRDAPGDLDLAVDLMTEATGRFPAGTPEWGVALGGLADRLFARYTKHHRDADFAATEGALRTAFDAGRPDRPSMWLRLGLLLHRVANPIVMALLFYGTVLPTGLVMRLKGRDLLRLKREPDAVSYWIVRDPPGPSPETMRDQF